MVIDAISLLKSRGKHIPVVMTGLPSDHRDPSNRNLSRLLQAIATADLAGQIIFLGQIPYADLVNLMRAAAVVIQPSLFEGWCTIVQDAKAIGRPLICSDLSVHREQAPDAIGFFPTNGRSLKFREKIPPDYSTGNGTFAVHSKRPEDRWRVRVFSFSERLHEDATFGQPRSLL